MRNAKKINIIDKLCIDPTLFVNRNREITEYLQWCNKISSNNCNLLFVLGEKGIGKSSLLMQLKECTQKKDSDLLKLKGYNFNTKLIYSFGYNVYSLNCLPGDNFIKLLFNILYPRKFRRLNGGNFSAFGFGAGLNFERNLFYDYYLDWIKKICKKNSSNPIVIFIDDIQNLKDINDLDTYVKIIFEIIQKQNINVNLNFVFSGECQVERSIKYPSLSSIIKINKLAFSDYEQYLSVLSSIYNFEIADELITDIYNDSQGNFRNIINILQNLEYRNETNFYSLREYKNSLITSYGGRINE